MNLLDNFDSMALQKKEKRTVEKGSIIKNTKEKRETYRLPRNFYIGLSLLPVALFLLAFQKSLEAHARNPNINLVLANTLFAVLIIFLVMILTTKLTIKDGYLVQYFVGMKVRRMWILDIKSVRKVRVNLIYSVTKNGIIKDRWFPMVSNPSDLLMSLRTINSEIRINDLTEWQ